MTTPEWLSATFFTKAATVTHRSRAATGDWGADEFTTTGTSTANVQIEPVDSAELLAGQTTRTTTHRLVAPVTLTLGPDDLVVVDGVTYELTGPARQFDHPAPTGTGGHHVEADLATWTG